MFVSEINHKAGAALSEAFGGVAKIIHEDMNEWSEEALVGQKAAGETTHTENLLSGLRREFRSDSRAQQILKGLGVTVQCDTFNAPVGDEKKYGIDIGVRISIECSRYRITKALLIQCKKMSNLNQGGQFVQLRGDGESQAEKMLRVTPASFFMLFSAGDNTELLRKAGRLANCSVCGQPVCDIFPGCAFSRAYGGDSWNMGVSLIPASRVLARSFGKGKAPFPIESDVVLSGALPFGIFMSDLFASCMVGDVRTEVIDIATAPGRRDSPSRGLAPRVVDDLSASAYIDLLVKAE